MKAFSVNKNSWHYRLNVKMCKTNERLYRQDLVEKYVMSKDNLCSYWRMTLWSLFKVAVAAAFILALASLVLFLVYTYGYALIFNTAEAVAGTIAVLLLFGTAIGVILLGAWLDKRKRAKLDKILNGGETETSLAKAQYSSWKSGVCVPVEFKE
jgi:hypothetical protein